MAFHCYLRRYDGTIVVLGPGCTTIGREGCDHNVPFRGVSFKHATVSVDGDMVWIQDEGSKNGTFVNGRKLDCGCPLQIHPGDIVRVSRSRSAQFSFQVGEPSEDACLDLVSVARALNDHLGESEVLQLLLNLSVNAVKADRGFILPLEMVRTKRGRPIACWPESQQRQDGTLPDGTLREWGIAEKAVLDASDSEVRSVGVYPDVRDTSSLENCVLSMPVVWRHNDRCSTETVLQQQDKACVVYLECSSRASGFSEADKNVVSALFDHVAVSLERAQRVELEFELKTAGKIQQQLLPTEFSQWQYYEVHARNVPARYVGGDFFDFVRIGPTRMGLTLGDVSGHGLPASVMMSGVMASVWNNARNLRGPTEVLRSVNDFACCHFSDGKYVTMLYGELHSSGLFSWVSAGHFPPIVVRKTGELTSFAVDSNVFPIGVVPSSQWDANQPTEAWTQLAPADVVVIFTDGVIEASNADECYGRSRLLDALATTSSNMSCQDIVEGVLKALRGFVRNEALDDDVTLLACRYVGPQEHAVPQVSSADKSLLEKPQ